jgi:hypothetical protein
MTAKKEGRIHLPHPSTAFQGMWMQIQNFPLYWLVRFPEYKRRDLLIKPHWLPRDLQFSNYFRRAADAKVCLYHGQKQRACARSPNPLDTAVLADGLLRLIRCAGICARAPAAFSSWG